MLGEIEFAHLDVATLAIVCRKYDGGVAFIIDDRLPAWLAEPLARHALTHLPADERVSGARCWTGGCPEAAAWLRRSQFCVVA